MEGNTSNTIGVKLSYEGQMRRFPYNGSSFGVFYEQVVTLLGLEKTADIVLKYTDEENDLITISSDLELNSAIVPGQLLRVVATPRVNAPPVIQQEQPSPMQVRQQPAQIHHHQFPQAGHQFPHAAPQFQHAQFQHAAPQFFHEQPAPDQPMPFAPAGNFGAFAQGCGHGMDKKWAKMERKHEKFAKKMGHHGPHAHPHGPHAHGPHGHAHGHPHAHPHVHPHGHPHHQHFAADKLVARFVADVTIEDGEVLPPQAAFTKTWRVRNEGAPWPAGCGLLFVGKASDDMAAPAFIPIEGVVDTHQELNISVPLIAPAKPGRYTGYFRMCTAERRKFGQRVWVSIVVPSAAGDSSSEGEKEADKYEALVDIVMRNEQFRTCGIKRHWVFRLLQKCDGDIEKVTKKLEKRVSKKNKKSRKM